MKTKHHARINYCTDCGCWQSRCEGCGWSSHGSDSFSDALRRIRLHQLDRTYIEYRPSFVPADVTTAA